MVNAELKNFVVSRILPNVRTPAQYLGGELNSVVKDHRDGRGDASAWPSPTPTPWA